MANKTITPFVVALILLPSMGMADAYRYQDKNGQTVYTQYPPTNVEATAVRPPPPPASSGLSEKAAMEKKIADDNTAQAKEAKEQELAAIHALTENEKYENCLRARQQLTNLQLRNRIKMIGPDGQAVMLTEEQKMAEITKTKEAINSYCTKTEEQQ